MSMNKKTYNILGFIIGGARRYCRFGYIEQP